MGSHKSEMARADEARRWIEDRLVGGIDTGHMSRCDAHESTFDGGGEPDEIAAELFGDDLPSCINDRQELLQAIRDAFENAGSDECPMCARNMSS